MPSLGGFQWLFLWILSSSPAMSWATLFVIFPPLLPSPPSSPSSGIPVICVLNDLVLSHRSLRLCSFSQSLPLLLFRLWESCIDWVSSSDVLSLVISMFLLSHLRTSSFSYWIPQFFNLCSSFYNFMFLLRFSVFFPFVSREFIVVCGNIFMIAVLKSLPKILTSHSFWCSHWLTVFSHSCYRLD